MPFPPLGVPADLQSAANKCPNLFYALGYVIPSNQDVVCNVMGMGISNRCSGCGAEDGLWRRRWRTSSSSVLSLSFPLILASYFMSSELSMVMVLPSILMAPFSSNSDRQRRSENFWIPKISAISWRLTSSRMVLLCCSVAILMRYCATFSLTEKRRACAFSAKGRYLSLTGAG